MIHVRQFAPGRAPRLALAALVAAALAAIPVAMAGPGAAQHARASAYDHHEARTQIVWSRYTADGGAVQLVASGLGGSVRELTATQPGISDVLPRISPDGRQVVFQRESSDGSIRLGVVGIDGDHERILDLGCADPCIDDQSPTWAPDGRHLLFTRVLGPYIPETDSFASVVLMSADLSGHRITRVSPPGIDGVYEDYGATFAPDGTMYFLRVRDSDALHAAFRRSPGGHVQRLTPWSLDVDEVSVSPARRGPTNARVVFETGTSGGRSAAVATVDGRCRSAASCVASLRYLTSPGPSAVANYHPAWSPDGRSIAYVRDETRSDGSRLGDIWTMSWDGSHKRRFSVSPLFDKDPSWGPAPAHRH
ncbi:hypothetical protein [Nocardioides sp. KR10-350]|uniref:hypothetical protein n=1 Tax=Nocardioides cheoyonin TaxID=3156615 RepID=UPI0032B4BB80